MNYRHTLYLAPLALLFSIAVKANVQPIEKIGDLKKAIQDNENVVIKIYADWCGHCKHAAGPFKELADEHKDAVKSVAINADNNNLKSIVQKLGVTGFPTFVFIKNESTPGYKEIKISELSAQPLFMKKVVGFNHEGLKTAMKHHAAKAGHTRTTKKAATEKPFSLNEMKSMAELKKTVAQAFKHNKHVVIKVETPWCGACKQAAPEFHGLMEKYHKTIQGAIVDGETAEFSTLLGKKLKIQAYPSFIFIRKDTAKGFEELDFTDLHDKPVYVDVIRGFSELFKRDLAVLAGVPGAQHVTVTRAVEEPEKEAVVKPAKKHFAKKPVAKKHHKKPVQKEVCSQD